MNAEEMYSVVKWSRFRHLAELVLCLAAGGGLMTAAIIKQQPIGGVLAAVALVFAALAWRQARQFLPARDSKVARALRGQASGGDRLAWVYIVTTETRPLAMLRDQDARGNGIVTKLTTGVKIKLHFVDGAKVELFANVAPAEQLLEHIEHTLPGVALGYTPEAEREYRAVRRAA